MYLRENGTYRIDFPFLLPENWDTSSWHSEISEQLGDEQHEGVQRQDQAVQRRHHSLSLV